MNRIDCNTAFSLEGEVAVVTGGGTGLGLAIASCLCKAGARVVITGRRKELLDSAVRELGSSAVALAADVSELATLPGLLRQVCSQVGPLTILVNNAGVHLKKPGLETTDSDFAAVIQIHLCASFSLCREAAKLMLPRQKGSILFVGSMSSLFGIPNVSAYSAAKAAVIGLTRSLATEWSPQGVRVNSIVPGWIDTGMAREALSKDTTRRDKILSRTPMQRLGDADDIGWAAVYLCSPAAKFITGCSLVIDGGASIGF